MNVINVVKTIHKGEKPSEYNHEVGRSYDTIVVRMIDMGVWYDFNCGAGCYNVLAKNVSAFYPTLISLLEV